MEKIKINHTGPAYGIQSITPVSEHVIRIVFAGIYPGRMGRYRCVHSGRSAVRQPPGV